MRRLIFILLQLDEARRYIEDGRTAQLRLALLLLDNAVEMQLDRRIRHDLSRERLRERMRATMLRTRTGELPEELRALAEWEPLSEKQRQRIDRFFEEKLRYLSSRESHLDPRLVGPLSHLHKYRNEAYHKSRVRPETLRTAGIILLEINCQLLVSFGLPITTYSSDEDYSWLQDRFGISAREGFFDESRLSPILSSLTCNLLPATTSLAGTLRGHLQSRYQEIFEALDFIVENTKIPDRGAALRYCQFRSDPRGGAIDPRVSHEAYVGKETLESLERFPGQIESLSGAEDRVDAFRLFSLVEPELEIIEESIHAAAAEIDEMIQFEIDRARGK